MTTKTKTNGPQRKAPPVKRNGKCARRGCTKDRMPNVRNLGVDYAAYDDPFCSTDCCRAYYGVSLQPVPARN